MELGVQDRKYRTGSTGQGRQWRMAEGMDSYLCFCVDEIYYIVTVMEVEKICLLEDAGQENLIWLGLGDGGFPGDRTGLHGRCAVVLKEGGRRFAVAADYAEGVVQIAPMEQYEIPQALQELYPWLLGAAVQKEKKRVLLLLDGQRLDALAKMPETEELAKMPETEELS